MSIIDPLGGPPVGPHLVGMHELRRNWLWFLALGIALVVLGTVALGASVATTLVSVAFLGWLLLFGGALEVGHAFYVRQWGGFFLALLSGLIDVVLGVLLVRHPAKGAAGLTLFIAAVFLVGGAFRVIAALSIRFPKWGWMLVSGVVTFLLGVLIWSEWPQSGLWVIGTFVGINLLFNGWSLVMLGLTARRLAKAV